MEYTVTNKQVMHLKQGDVIYNHITKDEAKWDKITKIMRPDSLDDTEITCEDGDEIYCDETATFLVRVPSSPVMGFEEFGRQYYPTMKVPHASMKYAYEGYLIGTRSIVPEMDKDVKFLYEMSKSVLEALDGGGQSRSYHAPRLRQAIISFEKSLRSQINK